MNPVKKPAVLSARKRVLIVDDERMVLDLTCDFLEEAGFETIESRTTGEALEEMEKAPADLVLLDIRLPDGDGLTALQDLRKRHPKVPVVVLTGSGYDEDLMRRAQQNGAAAYVSKDTDLENMVAAVKRALRQA